MRRAARLPLERLQPYLLETPAVGQAASLALFGPAECRGRASEAACPTEEPSDDVKVAEASEAACPTGRRASLDWAAVFGNVHPVEIEVGSGKGLFLVTVGLARPDTNFLGIEIERKYALYTATRLAKRGLGNVRVACADARRFLSERVPGASVQAVHVYFPDPWWKTRHRKRRLFTAEFVEQCARVLQFGGCMHVATDVADYFGVMLELLRGRPELAEMPPPEAAAPRHDLDYLTNFERKYRQADKAIHRALFRKQSK